MTEIYRGIGLYFFVTFVTFCAAFVERSSTRKFTEGHKGHEVVGGTGWNNLCAQHGKPVLCAQWTLGAWANFSDPSAFSDARGTQRMRSCATLASGGIAGFQPGLDGFAQV